MYKKFYPQQIALTDSLLFIRFTLVTGLRLAVFVVKVVRVKLL